MPNLSDFYGSPLIYLIPWIFYDPVTHLLFGRANPFPIFQVDDCGTTKTNNPLPLLSTWIFAFFLYFVFYWWGTSCHVVVIVSDNLFFIRIVKNDDNEQVPICNSLFVVHSRITLLPFHFGISFLFSFLKPLHLSFLPFCCDLGY